MLTHPTLAEQAIALKRSATKTISVVKIARKLGAEVTYRWDARGLTITYTFDDDSSLTVRGRGKYHYMEAHLP